MALYLLSYRPVLIDCHAMLLTIVRSARLAVKGAAGPVDAEMPQRRGGRDGRGESLSSNRVHFFLDGLRHWTAVNCATTDA